MGESDRFDVLTGQKVSSNKTVGFNVPEGDTPLLSRGIPLRIVMVDKLLGVLVPMGAQCDPTLQDRRIAEARQFIDEVARMPVPLEENARLISLKTAGARYGLEVAMSSRSAVTDFDQKALQVLCGPRVLRCKTTSMALARMEGHLFFLEMATPYQAFAMARRQLCRSELARRRFQEVWEHRVGVDLWQGAGVCAHLWQLGSKFGWQWNEPFPVVTSHYLDLDLLCPLPGWYQHRLRVALRQGLLATTASRSDLMGIHAGVNYELTTALLFGGRLGAEDRCRLRFL